MLYAGSGDVATNLFLSYLAEHACTYKGFHSDSADTQCTNMQKQNNELLYSRWVCLIINYRYGF